MSAWQTSYTPTPTRHKRVLLLLAALTVLAAVLSLAAGPRWPCLRGSCGRPLSGGTRARRGRSSGISACPAPAPVCWRGQPGRLGSYHSKCAGQPPGRSQHHRGKCRGGADGGSGLYPGSHGPGPHAGDGLCRGAGGGAAGAGHRPAHRGFPADGGPSRGGGVQCVQRRNRCGGHLCPGYAEQLRRLSGGQSGQSDPGRILRPGR